MSTESTNKLINIVGLNTFLTNLKENTLSNYAKNDDVIDQDTIEELIQNSIISNPDNDSIELKDIVTGIKINGIINTPNNGIVELGVTGNYNKPSNGIPVSDLDSSIQGTLNDVRINKSNISTITNSVNTIENNISSIESNLNSINPIINEVYNKTQKIYYINNIDELNEVYPLNTGLYITADGMLILQIFNNLSRSVFQTKIDITANIIDRRYQIVSNPNNITSANAWTEWTNYFKDRVIGDITYALIDNQLTTGKYSIIRYSTDDKLVEIQSNRMHIWGVMDSLEISFAQGEQFFSNEYLFQFDSGETPTRLALPANIKWVNGEIPVIEANYTYQVSVLNDCASIMKFKTV